MAKGKNKVYTVNAKITTISSILINANSLEEALENAKKLEASNFVDVIGENLDGEYKLLGVSEDEWL